MNPFQLNPNPPATIHRNTLSLSIEMNYCTMSNISTMNQRSSKQHVDPPKSDGGVFAKANVQTSVPRVLSYGNFASSSAQSDNNNNLPAVTRRSRRRPHPSAAIPGIGPQLYGNHRRRGAVEDPSYSSCNAPTHKNDKKYKSFSDRIPTIILVILWYSFGVVSIATSKILLSTYYLPPLLLTLQQLMIGMFLLRTLLHVQTKGKKDEEYASHAGLQSVPVQGKQQEHGSYAHHHCENGTYERKSSNDNDPRGNRLSKTQQQHGQHGILSALLALANPSAVTHRIHNQLLLSSIYFTIGFLLTNYGFSSGSAAFVETVKAAEPITSAATAVIWGIEQLVPEEVASLGGIIVGVVLSTLGHRSNGVSSSNNELELTSQSLLKSSFIVLLANLCFSFRGLHQKLFRSTPQGKVTVVDDLNLQYRMQQIGCLLLSVPALLQNSSLPSRVLQYLSTEEVTVRLLLRYVMLCLVNGVVFASYNLSSTTILTRISVVHHAALNCIRRVFAILVTSILFGLKMTFLQIGGILVSVGAFFSYIHFKTKKSLRQSRRREMKEKWGNLMLDAKSGRWTGKINTSSSLPMGSAED